MLGGKNVWYIFTQPETVYTEIETISGDTIIENVHYKIYGYALIREDTYSQKV